MKETAFVQRNSFGLVWISKETTLDIHRIHCIHRSKVSDILIHRKSELWISVDTMDTMDIHEIQNKNLELWISFYAFYGYPNGYPKRGMDIHLNLWISKWKSKKGMDIHLDCMDIQMEIQKGVMDIHFNLWISKWISKMGDGYPFKFMDVQMDIQKGGWISI